MNIIILNFVFLLIFLIGFYNSILLLYNSSKLEVQSESKKLLSFLPFLTLSPRFLTMRGKDYLKRVYVNFLVIVSSFIFAHVFQEITGINGVTPDLF